MQPPLEMQYQNVVSAFYSTKWAIMPEVMPRLVSVVNNWSVGLKASRAEIDALLEARARPLKQVDGKVAVLPLFGVVAQRLNILDEISGGTSTEMFGKMFDDAISNSKVGAVVLNIDSPGGSVYGVAELADKIFAARGKKPILAVANSLAASAAYWIGTAADQLIVTPSGEVGSIGVLAMHVDFSKCNEMAGVQPTYIYAGKYKVEGNPDEPLDPEAKGAIQQEVDAYYDMFTKAVARNRDVSVQAVRSGFGEGRVVTASRAKEMGMVDRVETLDGVLSTLTSGGSGGSGRRAESQDRARVWRQKLRKAEA